MRRLLYLVSCALVTFTANAQLKNVTNADDIAKIKSANEKVTSFTSSFSQTKKMAFIDGLTKSEGDFYYTNSGKLAMKYASGDAIVINDGDVSLGMNGKKRKLKSSNRHVEGLVNALFSAVSGDVMKLDGTLEKVNKAKDAITFVVNVNFTVGKSKVKKLELVYATSDLTVSQIKMIEADESYTLYEIPSKKINVSIDNKVFAHTK